MFMNLFKYSRVKAAKQNIRSDNKSIEYLIEHVDKLLLLDREYLCIYGRFKDANLSRSIKKSIKYIIYS